MPYLNASVSISDIVSSLYDPEDFADFVNDFGASKQHQEWFREVVSMLDDKGTEMIEILAAAVKLNKG